MRVSNCFYRVLVDSKETVSGHLPTVCLYQIMIIFWLLLNSGLKFASSYDLIQSLIVSRHGVRSPYPPNYGTVSDFTAYTDLIFPDNTSWGMTYEDFESQHLTPHGEKIAPYMGKYSGERFIQQGLDISDCANIVCFADDNSRDIMTAQLWLSGLGCSEVEVSVVNSTSFSEMQPVVQDEFDVGCPNATENQVNGLYGGDPDTLTNIYYNPINLVMDVIEMPLDAEICSLTNDEFVPTDGCTLFDTGYLWTGAVYDGTFKSPTYYAKYFAEHWMLQYLSNVTDWAFGKLTLAQLNDLYAMQVKTLWFGTNYW